MLERVKWFRNAPEKDQDKQQGIGTLVQLNVLEKLPEAMALILDDDGNFVEKQISLIQVVDTNASVITKLEQELVTAHKRIEELEKAVDNTRVAVKPVKVINKPAPKGKGI